MSKVHEVRVGLSGLGSVHRNLVALIWKNKRELLRERFGLEFRCVWACDSSGFRIAASGFDAQKLGEYKAGSGSLANFSEGTLVSEPDAIAALSDVDLLFEATPVEFEGGGLGLRLAREATSRGIHVVLANKAPLVLDFAELSKSARRTGAGLAFSATVCGGLPVVNVGSRDLVGARVHRMRGIFNSTTNFMLDEIAKGRSYDEALAEAQARGIAETDPRNDVEGWDTAAKLVILANSVLEQPVTLADVDIQGISDQTQFDSQSVPKGHVTKLIAEATLVGTDNDDGDDDRGYTLSVQPLPVPSESFLGSCDGWELGIEFETDIYGKIFLKIWEREPIPTAAAMMRDAVHLLRVGHTEAGTR